MSSRGLDHKLQKPNMTITISVKLFASLAAYKPYETDNPTCDIMLPEDATIEQLVLKLGIPVDKVRTISLNEKIVKSDIVLSDGDILILFPTIAGG
jgi:molybdopterin converting factor small subunit